MCMTRWMNTKCFVTLFHQVMWHNSCILVQFRSPCPVCGKKYSDLRQHVRIVHEGAKVSLKDVIKWDNLISELDVMHIQAECPHCKGKYSNLSQHIHKVHLKTKNIMCDKCGMTFYHNSNLKKHLETAHTGSRLMAVQPSVYPILGHPADMVGFPDWLLFFMKYHFMLMESQRYMLFKTTN